MKNNIFNKNLAFFSLFTMLLAVSISSAQNTSSNSSTTDSKEIIKDALVEIYLPMNKDEFLIYYGLTNNEETNLKIEALRKEFIQKIEIIKTEYKADLKDITKEKELTPSPNIQKKEEIKDEPAVATAKEAKVMKTSVPMAKIEPAEKIVEPVKYKLTNEKQISIAPAITISNTKTTPYTEVSSWFQKIKSWFKW